MKGVFKHITTMITVEFGFYHVHDASRHKTTTYIPTTPMHVVNKERNPPMYVVN